MTLKKTVTHQVPVDPRIADLVYFVKSLRNTPRFNFTSASDDELIELAEDFWDSQHGED